MLNLKTLFDFLEKKLDIRISGKYNLDTIINEVLFLKDDIKFSQRTLYLTTKISKSLLINDGNILVVLHKASKNMRILQLETKSSIDEIYRI